MQRQSEVPKKEHKYEEYVAYVYRLMGFNAHVGRQYSICFSCGKFQPTDGKHYPKGCQHCGKEYGCEDGEYCIPDFLIFRLVDIANKSPDTRFKFAALFVDGEVHGAGTKRAKKDKFQRDKLDELGIMWYVITNDQLRYTEPNIIVNFLASIYYNLTIRRNGVYDAGRNAVKAHDFIKEWEKRHRGDNGYGL